MKFLLTVPCLALLMACAPEFAAQSPASAPAPIPEPGHQTADDSVVRGIAVVKVSSAESVAKTKFLPFYLISSAYAQSSGSSKVVYNNAPNVTFTVDTTALVAGAFNGNTLSLGQVTVTDLKDNDLNVCTSSTADKIASSKKKCTTAEIRVYTTGGTPGFVNISESPNYGMPVFATGMNPTTAVPLNSPGIAVQQVTNIPASKHNLKLADFPSPTYRVASDFTEAGSGSYEMTFVIEYALKP